MSEKPSSYVTIYVCEKTKTTEVFAYLLDNFVHVFNDEYSLF